MKIGDLVRFAPEVAILTRLEDRPLGVVVKAGVVHPNGWDTRLQMVAAFFPDDGTLYSCTAKDFEVVNENW